MSPTFNRHDSDCPTQNGATPEPCDCGATITAPISLTPEEWDRVGEALADVCTIWWTGPCEVHGDEWHRCARLTDHDGDHGCECGDDSPAQPSVPRIARPSPDDPHGLDDLARSVAEFSVTHCGHGFTWGQCCPKPYPEDPR